MDNILLVDIGNSSVKWAMTTSVHDLIMSQQLYPKKITKAFFIECWKDIGNPQKLLVTSVAEIQVWQAFEEAAFALWNLKAERVISKAQDYGVINAYTKPSDLGSDRWCALIGAFHATDSDVVVIDCGTAITIDVVTKLGRHLGGYILPGLGMMKGSLGLQTAQINISNNSAEEVSLMLGNSTSECIEGGVLIAAVSFIDNVINQQLKRTADLNCLLTGGDAELVAPYLNNQCVVMSNLVLRGLAYIAEHESPHINNQEKLHS